MEELEKRLDWIGLDWINIFQFAICYIGLGAIVDDDDDG